MNISTIYYLRYYLRYYSILHHIHSYSNTAWLLQYQLLGSPVRRGHFSHAQSFHVISNSISVTGMWWCRPRQLFARGSKVPPVFGLPWIFNIWDPILNFDSFNSFPFSIWPHNHLPSPYIPFIFPLHSVEHWQMDLFVDVFSCWLVVLDPGTRCKMLRSCFQCRKVPETARAWDKCAEAPDARCLADTRA